MGRYFVNKLVVDTDSDSFDDNDMRLLFIKFAKETLGINFISGSVYGIDLVSNEDPTWGAEGENASWDGDRWEGVQNDIFKLGISTINIQNWKWFYFGLGELSKKNYGKYLKTHDGFEKNLYFRVNRQLDQICLVESHVIRDSTKSKIVRDKSVSNTDNLEDWICVPKEFVRTFNKQPNGKFLENGPYCGITQSEIYELNEQREKLKQEKGQQRLKELALKKKLNEQPIH